MKGLTVELIPDLELGGYTARVPDIPAYGEGETEAEAIADLKEALSAFIEEFGIEEAVNRLNPPFNTGRGHRRATQIKHLRRVGVDAF